MSVISTVSCEVTPLWPATTVSGSPTPRLTLCTPYVDINNPSSALCPRDTNLSKSPMQPVPTCQWECNYLRNLRSLSTYHLHPTSIWVSRTVSVDRLRWDGDILKPQNPLTESKKLIMNFQRYTNLLQLKSFKFLVVLFLILVFYFVLIHHHFCVVVNYWIILKYYDYADLICHYTWRHFNFMVLFVTCSVTSLGVSPVLALWTNWIEE